MAISEKTNNKLAELKDIVESFRENRYDTNSIANDFIDNSSDETIVSIGYAIRLMNLLCDYFYENDEELYDDMRRQYTKIRSLYDTLNY